MKHILSILALLPLSLLSLAQMTPYTPTVSKAAHGNREGRYGGIALGYFHYSTHWYYYNGSGAYRDNYAAHSLNRTVVSLSLEHRAFRKIDHFDFDLGGELLLGPFGNAKASYLSGNNTISSGGWAAGLNFYGRAVYRPSNQENHIYPFAGIGPQYMYLHNSGKGSGTAGQTYGYADGWNEGILLFALSLGVEMQLEGYTLTPELRLGLFGWNSSSWTPHGKDVGMNGGPGFFALGIRLSKPF